MPRRPSLRSAAVALLITLSPLLAACSSDHAGASAPVAATVGATASAATSPAPTSPSTAPGASASAVYPTTDAAPGTPPMQVRDAFAVLQATYNDSCATPGNCPYFLSRVLTNLDDLDAAMKASSEGPAHFARPLAWIAQLHTALAGDVSYTNLSKHQHLLVATRNEINTWMQSHPEDYR